MKALKFMLMGVLCVFGIHMANAQEGGIGSVPLDQPGHIIDMGDSIFVLGGQETTYLIDDANVSEWYINDGTDKLNLHQVRNRMATEGERTAYLFTQKSKSSGIGKIKDIKTIIGAFYDSPEYTIDPNKVYASVNENFSQIKITWPSVEKADGYLIFRSDKGFVSPHVIINGSQQTEYTDTNVSAFSSFSYYIMPYGISRHNVFLSKPAEVLGATLDIDYQAIALSEAQVYFQFDMDNSSLLDLVNDAIHFTIQEEIHGVAGRMMYEELITPASLSSEELLFKKALKLSGDDTGGVYLDQITQSVSDWTLEMWVKMDRADGMAMTLFESGDGMSVFLNEAGEVTAQKNGTTYTSNGTVINKWKHLTFSSLNNELTAFINGKPLVFSSGFDPGSLTSNMKIGQSAQSANFNGLLGMIRVWNKARSVEQVAADYADIFVGQSIQFPDLIGQWRFEEEVVYPTDDIHQKVLTINSSNISDFTIKWETSEFDHKIDTYRAGVWLTAPTTVNEPSVRTYIISLFEQGTGQVLAQDRKTVTFPQPQPPVVTLSQHASDSFQVKVHIDPATTSSTLAADEYKVVRHTKIAGEWAEEKNLGFYPIDTASVYDEAKRLRIYARSSIDVYDSYNYEDEHTLRGGGEYKYTVTPYYNYTTERQLDEANQWSNVRDDEIGHQLPDLGIQAAGSDAIELQWSPEAWSYDTLLLERDNKLLSDISAKTQFTDSLVLYGQAYEYKMVAMRDGIPAFEQRYTHGLAPNGRFNGFLLSEGGFVLPFGSFEVTSANGNTREVIANENGTFDVDSLDYRTTASFSTAAGGTDLDYTFDLSYQEATHTALLHTNATYDLFTLDETPLTSFSEPVVVNNSILYQWDYLYDTYYEATVSSETIDVANAVFMNIYKQNEENGLNELVHVVLPGEPNSIRFYDIGVQELTFVPYLLLPEGSAADVWVDHEAKFNHENTLNTAADFIAEETAEWLLDLKWSYPSSDSIQHFIIERDQLNEDGSVIDETTLVFASVGQMPEVDDYAVTDYTGLPDTTYRYLLKVVTLSEEVVTIDTLDKTYPQVEEVIARIKTNQTNQYEIELNEETVPYDSWHGISVQIIEEETERVLQEVLLSKALIDGDHTIDYYQPQAAALPGTALVFQPFKRMDNIRWVHAGTIEEESFDEVKEDKVATIPDQIVGEPADDLDLQDPVITASKDARGQVFVSWTYPDYTDVTFEVQKTGLTEGWTVAEGWDSPEASFILPGTQRSMLDSTYRGEEITGHTTLYRMRAVYEDLDEFGNPAGTLRYSNWVGDYGIARAYQQVSGYVRNANGATQPYVWVGVDDTWVLSDAAGYYVISDLELAQETTLDIHFVAPGTTQITTQTISGFDPASQVNYHDIAINEKVNEFWMPEGRTGAQIVGLSVFRDNVDLTNKVRWMANGSAYSGFKFYNTLQREVEKQDVRNGQQLYYVDWLISNNPSSADYLVDSYLENALDEDVATSEAGIAFVEWVPFHAPERVSAFADQKNGWVELHFSHTRNNVDGFIIKRSDEEIGMVQSDTSYFRDLTGIPGERYPYTVYSYIERNGQIIESQLPSAMVDAEYPAPGRILDFVAKETVLEDGNGDAITDSKGNVLKDNSVTLTWQYPDEEVAIKGVAIYRELDQIAILDAPDTVFVDKNGVPETYTQYAIRSYDYRDGAFYFGADAAYPLNYPHLQQPVDFTMAGYNGEIDPQDQLFDSLKIYWEYYASAVDGFELIVMDESTEQIVVDEFIEYDPNETTYEYLFKQGFSEVTYTAQLKVISTRAGYTYYSEEVRDTTVYDKLPAPAFYENEFIVTLDGSAVIDGKRVRLDWGFEHPENLDYDGLLLTLEYWENSSGSWEPYIYEYETFGNTESIGFNELTLASGQEMYEVLMNEDEFGERSFRASIQAYQLYGTAQRLSDIRTLEFGVNLPETNKYPQHVEATNGLTTNVQLSWDYPTDRSNLSRFIIYRDGVVINRVAPDIFGFTDANADPGIQHLYEIAAEYSDNGVIAEYKTPVLGSLLGSASIIANVLSTNLVPLAGMRMKISGVYNGFSYDQEVETDSEGNAVFNQLAFNKEGVDYTIKPVDDGTFYDPASQAVTLSYVMGAGANVQFFNTRTRFINGIVRNVNCASGCGHDSVTVTLMTKLYGEPAYVENDVMTDENGQFTLAVPYNVEIYDSLYLLVANTRTDGLQSLDSIYFDFLLTENSWWEGDDLRVELLDLFEEEEQLNIEILENNAFPLNVKVSGPGDCEALSDYEFLLRIYDDRQKLEEWVWTVDQQVDSLILPPYNHRIQVVDVNKNDVFSEVLLDYFRSRELYLDSTVTSFKKVAYELDMAVEEDSLQAISLRDTVHHLRYNERADLVVVPQDAENPLSCGDYDLVMSADGVDYNQYLTFQVQPQQTINGILCDANTGYIVPRFSGGYWYNTEWGEDVQYPLIYDESIDEWDMFTLVATTPNMNFPYTQLLELYYYDANGSFQGSYTQEILVLGLQSAPGNDVFIVTGDEVIQPLYVLRDPPGDNSYAYISEKSSFSFEYEKKVDYHFGAKADAAYFGALGWVSKESTASENVITDKKNTILNSVALEFKESLSTVKKAVESENVEGYLDGPDADLVVGLNMVVAYGVMERLMLDGCAPTKTKTLEVDPDQISSTWIYTRSQIQNTVDYYRSLLKKDENGEPIVGNNGYEFEEGVDFTYESTGEGDQIITDVGANGDPTFDANSIGNSYYQFNELLNSLDSRFTPACEMCEMVEELENEVKIYYRRKYNIDTIDPSEDLVRHIENIKDFCKQYILDSEFGECRDFAEVVSQWDEEVRNKYNDVYRQFVADIEFIAFVNTFRTIQIEEDVFVEQLEDRLKAVEESFSPQENITFGAGATYKRGFDRETFSLEADGLIFSFSSVKKLKNSIKKEVEVASIALMGYVSELGSLIGTGRYKNLNFSDTKKTHDLAATIDFRVTTSASETYTEFAEFSAGYSLSDDDDGDTFTSDIFYPMTNVQTSASPYFVIMGGRSSCPYEPGTIPRDMPRIQLTDESGELYPTKYYDLHHDQPISIPVALSSGNLFDEERLVQVTVPLGTNKNGLAMQIETVKVNNYRGSVSLVEPDEPYFTNLIIDRNDLPYYEFDDIELLVKPNCHSGKGTYWEEEPIYDTLKLEFYFQKPISPVALSTENGEWLVNAEELRQTVALKVTDYDVRQELHSFKEIYLEYRRKSDQYWTRLSDAARGYAELSGDFLLDFYEENLNTYQDPTYPVIWDPSGEIDGEYAIRATIVHDNGTTAFSNEVFGLIDTKRPDVAEVPAPADGVFSLDDNIAITFDEAIDCDKFNGESGIVEVTTGGVTIAPFLYSIICDGSSVSLLVDPDVIQEYDGQVMTVRVSGIYDLNNNASVESVYEWEFQLDYLKQTPSGFTATGPEAWVVNATSPSELFYTISDYDVYQKTNSIENISLWFKKENALVWELAASVSIGQLITNYEALEDRSLSPRDTLRLETTALVDGAYDIQIVLTGATGLQNVQGMSSGIIDREAPALLGVPSPVDSVYDPGDEVVLSFTESIDCDDTTTDNFYSEISTTGSLVMESFDPVRFQCTGDQLLVVYDESLLNDKLGQTIRVGLKNVQDLAGNVTDSLYHEFTVAEFGKVTSSASIVESHTQWVVNLDEPATTFTLTGYDLYELHHSLDSIVLEFSVDREVWYSIDTVDRKELRLYFEANGGATNTNVPVYPIVWYPPISLQDTVVEVRAKVFGEGFPQYSAAAIGNVDRVSPELASATPEDDVITSTTQVALTFTEEIDEASLNESEVVISQVAEGTENSLLDLDPVMYQIVLEEDIINVYFDELLASQFAGEQLHISVKSLRDLYGNALIEMVDERFDVKNTDGVNLDFSGEQLETGAIQLEWNNVSENIAHYEVERSADGYEFEWVATIPTEAVERYNYKELTGFENVIYYRLKLHDENGQYTRSKVVVIEGDGTLVPASLDVYPNPLGKDRVLKFSTFNVGADEISVARVLDLKGSVLVEQEIATLDQVHHSIKLSDTLTPGTYLLSVKSGAFESAIRFVIE